MAAEQLMQKNSIPRLLSQFQVNINLFDQFGISIQQSKTNVEFYGMP
jgi:hypothetical protein